MWSVSCGAARLGGRCRRRRGSKSATACARRTFIQGRIRACRAMCAATWGWSSACTALTSFLTPWSPATGRIRSGFIRCASTPKNFGERMRTRPSKFPSKHLSLISNMSENSFIQLEAARRATEAIPSIPRDANGPIFREPWEAHAFAMAIALHDRRLFTWSEWAAKLAEEIKKAQANGDPDTGETYYRHWLATLERIVAEKDVTTPQALAQHHDAWDRAAQRTPHGTPIELKTEDFRGQ